MNIIQYTEYLNKRVLMQFENSSPIQLQATQGGQNKTRHASKRINKNDKISKDRDGSNDNNQEIDMGPEEILDDQDNDNADDGVGFSTKKSNQLTKHQHTQNQYRPVLCVVRVVKFILFLMVVTVIVMVAYQYQYQSASPSDQHVNSSNSTNQSSFSTQSSNKYQQKEDQSNIEVEQLQKYIQDQVSRQQQSKAKAIQYNKENNLIDIQQIPVGTETKGNIDRNFNIKIEQFPEFRINNLNISQYGIDKDIQVGSIYDYLNITHSKQFNNFKQFWSTHYDFINKSQQYRQQLDPFKADILSFQYNSTFQMLNLEYTSVLGLTDFANEEQMNAYLNSLNSWNNKRIYGSDLQLYLSAHILWNQTSQHSNKLKQIELYHLQKKYNLSKYQDQLPICLFSTGYKIFSRQRHKYFLQSIQRQNYTNFHIVAVDDGSPDNSGSHIHEFLKASTMRIRNKIEVVINKENIGATASTYYWSKRLCRPGDIIVHVDMDDMLIGRQVFKTINVVYRNEEVWYAYTRFLLQMSPQKQINAGKSRPINFDVKTYRLLLDWKTSAMRTLRYQVMYHVPLEHVVQYHYNSTTLELVPKFYDTDADRFLIYSQLQLCSNKHVKYINDVFYYYNVTNNVAGKCNMYHEHFDEYKSRVKTPVRPLKAFGLIQKKNGNQKQSQVVVQFQDEQQYKIPNNVTMNLKDRYEKYVKCLKSN